MKTHLMALILVLAFSSCSSQRLRYVADVEESGSAKKFQFEKSYDVGGGIPAFCGLTAIFLGGACWFYLVMPTVTDEKQLQDDAELALKKAMQSKKYSVNTFRTEQVNWKDEPELFSVQ